LLLMSGGESVHIALEGAVARGELIEDYPQRVQIRARVWRATGRLLGGHVRRRPSGAEIDARTRSRQAKVHGHDPPTLVLENDVRRLEVAVHDPLRVHGFEAGADPARDA